MHRAALLFILVLVSFNIFSQDRCPTPVQTEEEILQFENWLLQTKQRKNTFQSSRQKSTIYTIPVVFHVIHNGEPIGTGYNIPTERILEQVDILNQDFRKMNPRSSSVPVIFHGVEADVEIEFVLARQTPEGNPTAAIIRKQGSRIKYDYPNHNTLLKSESYWPSEDYLNIWIANTSVLGWATFPEGSGLGGISPDTNPLTDGVVVDGMWLGVNPDTGGSFESYGQTATHEIGHFLGLRHIWGDGGCSFDDYCDDTPLASMSNDKYGSPCDFPGQDSCTSDALPDMFMNFMDYTNDICMNMFTNDQRFRMRTVLENSPRRLSLLTSHGLDYPVGTFDLDLAISSVADLPIAICGSSLIPQLTLGNYGNDQITSFKLNYTVNGTTFEEIRTGQSLNIGELLSIDLPSQDLIEGANSFSFQITEVNGTQDENELNNSKSKSVLVNKNLLNAPFRELFPSANNWTLSAITGITEWGNQDERMMVSAFNSGSTIESWLISPQFSLDNFTEAGLFFDLSYAVSSSVDQLDVKIATNCLGDFQTIWSMDLDALGFEESTIAWTPSSDSDWKEQFINLTSYRGNDELRLAFVFTNKSGNNLFLDNVELTNNNDPNQPRLKTGRILAYPNPAKSHFDLTLSLPDAQPVRVQLFTISGEIVMDVKYEDVLNQTYRIETDQLFGTYFLRATGKNINQTQRILIGR